MSPDNENLPVSSETELTQGGTITYANEVIAIISGIAANEIEGIAGMVTSGGFGDIIGKNRNITRGVKVEVGTQEVSVDLYITVEYGQPIQKVASEVQENVRKSIEAMTGLKVVRVDVHVQGVSFEKEKKEAQSNLESANVPGLPGGRKKSSRSKEAELIRATEAEKKAEEAVAAPVSEEPSVPSAGVPEPLADTGTEAEQTPAPSDPVSNEPAAAEGEAPAASAKPPRKGRKA
ncbi:MAG: Asp23/Gls24 family envelope stress response protein [Christensenellales bacterium]